MKKCPECGFVFEKPNKSKPWSVFEFTEENFLAFKMILQKTLTNMRFHELSKMDRAEIQSTMASFRAGIPIPWDLTSKFETFRMGINVSLCAILEYFHLTRMAPKGCVRIKDTSVFSKYEKNRHLSAHIIADGGRIGKVLRDLHKLDIESTFTEISTELHLFMRNGIDKYLEMGKLRVSDLKNTTEARYFLELINDKRRKEGRTLINLNE